MAAVPWTPACLVLVAGLATWPHAHAAAKLSCANSTRGAFAFQVCTTPEGFRLQLGVQQQQQQPGLPAGVAVLVSTSIDGCRPDDHPGAPAAVVRAHGGTLSVTRTVRCGPGEYSAGSHTAQIVDSFALPVPPARGALTMAAALEWNSTASSASAGLWTAPVTSTVRAVNYSAETMQFWAGGVNGGEAVSAAFNPVGPRPINGCGGGVCELPYGGPYAVVQRGIPGEAWFPALALPAFSVLYPATGLGVSLVQSPETVAVGATLRSALEVGGSPAPAPTPPGPGPPGPGPPPPPAVVLSGCNASDSAQMWRYNGRSIQSVLHPQDCLALVKAVPYPAILWSCQAPTAQRLPSKGPTAQRRTAQGAGAQSGGGLPPSTRLGNDQLWQLSPTGQLLMEGFTPKGSKGTWCLGHDPLALGQAVRLVPCASGTKGQTWVFTGARGTPGLWRNGDGNCLAAPPSAPVGFGEQLRAQVGTGVVNYTRVYHRLGAGAVPATFTQHLLIHADCWRPAVGYMLEQWPEYFRPDPTVDIQKMEGAGAYADYRGGTLGAKEAKLKEMNFQLNWDAVFPYPCVPPPPHPTHPTQHTHARAHTHKCTHTPNLPACPPAHPTTRLALSRPLLTRLPALPTRPSSPVTTGRGCRTRPCTTRRGKTASRTRATTASPLSSTSRTHGSTSTPKTDSKTKRVWVIFLISFACLRVRCTHMGVHMPHVQTSNRNRIDHLPLTIDH